MGHDIWAYKVENKEIATYHRNAFSPSRHLIYEALDCMDLNGDVSGYGIERVFTNGEVKKAIEFVKAEYAGREEDQEDTIKFLEDCLKNCNENGIIVIDFS